MLAKLQNRKIAASYWQEWGKSTNSLYRFFARAWSKVHLMLLSDQVLPKLDASSLEAGRFLRFCQLIAKVSFVIVCKPFSA